MPNETPTPYEQRELSNSITQGNVVMVVRATTCCGNGRYLGRVFTVKCVYVSDAPCRLCGDTTRCNCADFHDIRTLRRIDPLQEPERREHPEPVAVTT